eukprot:355821-Chlamydomonas_euryale.AAC.9
MPVARAMPRLCSDSSMARLPPRRPATRPRALPGRLLSPAPRCAGGVLRSRRMRLTSGCGAGRGRALFQPAWRGAGVGHRG